MDKKEEDRQHDVAAPGHWSVVRDLISFQFKLLLDALRDFLLSPVSIVAVIAGIVSDQKDPGKYYRALMHWGRRSDHWINLFDEHNGQSAADQYVRKVEDIVVREYEKGGVVSKVKEQTDGIVGSIQSRSSKNENNKR